ncbi:MAG: sigma-70 family RNA polymerase sigma factor [Acidobacteriota bacterium]
MDEVTSTEPPSVVPHEPPRLVEHFFRHESAHLVAVLTRAFGIRHLDRIEESVQDAMLTAVETWSRRGIPDNPAGWIYRVARRRVLDALRRETIHQRAVGLVGRSESQVEAAIETLVDDWLTESRLPDSLLRMIFVCCHPALDRRSQIALTLNVLCGFGLAEIARGLLISTEAAKKRVQRAKATLAERQIQVDLPPTDTLRDRLAVVHEVLYLLFNEGYSTARGHEPIRDDICEEAARLTHLLATHETFGTPESSALLALMLAHSARLDARVDDEGVAILLADQDRSRWDRRLIRAAETWLETSKTNRPSRFHVEAAIALVHCRAPTVGATDWPQIVALYDRLVTIAPSPVVTLNRAIARGEAGDVETAFAEIETIRDHPDMRRYVLLDCATGRLHELSSNYHAAIDAYAAARAATDAPHERALLDRILQRLRTAAT